MNKTIIAVIGIIILAGAIFYASKNNLSKTSESFDTGVLEVVENDFDFGEILMTGGIMKHNFVVRNVGDGPVRIKNVETSCACTTANIFNADGKASGPFGMVGPSHEQNPKINMEVLPGEEITIEAVYDPLKHGPNAVGKIVREIFINTDTNKETSIKFRGEGVHKFSNTEGSSLKFNSKEYDFGIIKQSQGVVETKFEVVNNGTETVIVDSLPTSCECTKATIGKKEIAAGEKAIITVTFDANLHLEPEGRFFKTIEVVSNLKLSPELKIYVNMNYDLGINKLKSQEHDKVDGHTKEMDGHNGTGFEVVSSNELSTMLKNKDFLLIDVHTPEQRHVPGTDYMISYDEVDKIESVIPSKNSKVVLYCRSGNMSERVAKELVKRGYTNVFDLKNGMNGWQLDNRETLPKGSIKSI